MNDRLNPAALLRAIFTNKVTAWALCAVLVGLSVISGSACLHAEPAEEYALKAAFVLNFAKFTQWPAEAFSDATDRLDLCVVGDPLMRKVFKEIDGQKVDKRLMRVIFVEGTGELPGCALLFVGRTTDRDTLLKLIAAVAGKPVLTIGETEDFARIGGVMNFIVDDGKLHFEVNPETARQQKLTQSSRLLKLATIVTGRNPEDR